VNVLIGVNAGPAWIRLLLCSALAIGCLLGAAGPAGAATLGLPVGLPVDVPLPGSGTTAQSQPATPLERVAGATVDGPAAVKPVTDRLRAAAPAVAPATAALPASAAGPPAAGAAAGPVATAGGQSARSGGAPGPAQRRARRAGTARRRSPGTTDARRSPGADPLHGLRAPAPARSRAQPRARSARPLPLPPLRRTLPPAQITSAGRSRSGRRPPLSATGFPAGRCCWPG
jgi:hypothetical protein